MSLIMIIGGCMTKEAEVIVEPIYKTKIKYVSSPYIRSTSTKNKLKLVPKHKAKPIVSNKPKERYNTPKTTKIYAPQKYITRPNQKMNFMMGINPDGSEFVYMEGEFGTHTYTNFKKFIKTNSSQVKEIKISSNGGLVSTAMQIGAYVHDNKWSTGADKEMHCYSACGFVYFAGKNKSLQGRATVGLHRPYFPAVPDTPSSIQNTKNSYINYWNYIHAPKSVYDEMMDVSRDDLFILNKNNINDYINVQINEG